MLYFTLCFLWILLAFPKIGIHHAYCVGGAYKLAYFLCGIFVKKWHIFVDRTKNALFQILTSTNRFFGFWGSFLSFWESILLTLELSFGPVGVNFDLLWLNFGLLEVNFWLLELIVGLLRLIFGIEGWSLGLDLQDSILASGVDFRSLVFLRWESILGPQESRFGLWESSLRSSCFWASESWLLTSWRRLLVLLESILGL